MNLQFFNGPWKGKCVELQPPGLCIGRESDNDIQLLVAGISRYHAKLSFDGTRWSIQDLGSTNGTKVNGKIIKGPHVLAKGDELILGDQILIFGEKQPDPNQDHTVKTILPPPASPAKITPPQPVEMKHPVPPPPPVPDDDKNLDEDMFDHAKINIFEKKGEDGKKSADDKRSAQGKRGMKLLFPVLVISLGVVAAALFVKINTAPVEQNTLSAQTENKRELLVHYVRTITEPDNVFRFEFTLENGKAEFILDDLKYGRAFRKTFETVNPLHIQSLKESIRTTDFFKLKQEPPSAGYSGKNDEKRVLTIAMDHHFNTIRVQNTYAQSSFENIEKAIEQFAGDNGISTVSMNVEEMRKSAFDTFRKAEDLFANYQAKPENLREAIKRYQLAMDYLDQFVPRPPEWDSARKRLGEAKKIHRELLQQYDFNIRRYWKLKQFDKASEECQKAMDSVEPGSKAYAKLKSYKIAFDKQRRK